MRKQWYPGADTSQTYDVTGRQMTTVNTFVLHTTEGMSWPVYDNNFPTLTYNPRTHIMRQHCPVDYAAKGLVSGAIRTNWINVAQIEIIGTSGWNQTLAAWGWHIKDIDDQAVSELGALIRWLHTEWEVPLTSIQPWTHPRLNDYEYINFYGVLGHMHVPYNDHGDPGNEMPIDKVMAAAVGATSTTKPRSDFMMHFGGTNLGAYLVGADGAITQLFNTPGRDEVAVAMRIHNGDTHTFSALEMSIALDIIGRLRLSVAPAPVSVDPEVIATQILASLPPDLADQIVAKMGVKLGAEVPAP